MIWLNEVNGADKIEREYFEKCLTEFDTELIGLVMGSAYGGSIEEMGKSWKGRGRVYGYDVFEETHPKHLSNSVYDQEATCMEHWYQEDVHGVAKLDYQYQRDELDAQGLNHVILVKGEVQPDSCKDLPYINYAFLDMDILKSMDNGYLAVKDKMADGGYLLMHDVTGNLQQLIPWYNMVRENKEFTLVREYPEHLIVVLQKNGKHRRRKSKYS